MNISRSWTGASALIFALLLLLVTASVAIDPPHDTLQCSFCHQSNKINKNDQGLEISTLCLECHRAGGKGSNVIPRPANPYGTANKVIVQGVGSEHAFMGPLQNTNARATKIPSGEAFSGVYVVPGFISCVTCHNPHNQASTFGQAGGKFLRVALGMNDQLCFECHDDGMNVAATGGSSHPLTSMKELDRKHFFATPAFNNISGMYASKNNTVTCLVCHRTHGATMSTPTSVHNYGNGYLGRVYSDDWLCAQCHKKQIHGNSKGSAAVSCRDCHSMHAPGDNLRLIKKEFKHAATGAIVTVSFTNDAAAGNYYNAQGTGICQVCHRKTKYFKSYSATLYIVTGTPGHNAGNESCVLCHGHPGDADFMAPGLGQKPNFKTGSFQGACKSCHGFPPVSNEIGGPDGLAKNEGGTGSTSAGSHEIHAGLTGQGYGCFTCHAGGMPESPIYDKIIQIGFNLFKGAYTTGSYDGRNPLANDYTYQPGNAGTTVTLNGNKQCTNIYCHSNGVPFDKSTEYKQAVWGGAAMTCASCHGNAGSAETLSGPHKKHVAGSYTFACEKCHFDTIAGDGTIKNKALHANNEKNIKIKDGGSYDKLTKGCSETYCHSDGRGGSPQVSVRWSDTTPMKCDSCHKGRTTDTLTMSTNGHERLVGKGWIRQYPCYRCHNDTMNADETIKDYSKHLNGTRDVVMHPEYNVDLKPAASYDTGNMTCYNVYCHGDGTKDPHFKNLRWDQTTHLECDACHGHPITGNCSDVKCHPRGMTPWTNENKWKAAMPMYSSTGAGAGSLKPNSHMRHLLTNFSCNECHKNTIKSELDGEGNELGCNTPSCHTGTGQMTESAHLNASFHVNKSKDVAFKYPGSKYISRTCTNSQCHTGATPQWGDTVRGGVICKQCHLISGMDDIDDFGALFNNTRARLNQYEWEEQGHGRTTAKGNYPVTGNPPANFPASNPCWYCHDYDVLHQDTTNPFRLKIHPQFEKRYERECIYCHMTGLESECTGCHNAAESLAPQVSSADVILKHSGATYVSGCMIGGCHPDDATTHKTGAGSWTATQKEDIKNQYLMMGVCLQCHEDDRNDRCIKCHAGEKYKLGYDPGTGYIKAQKARASSVHYGYKHMLSGTKKGGKFCWDCHDPHGDSNIYMIQKKVATETDGQHGKPVVEKRKDVVFTDRAATSYASVGSGVSNRICNVCHSVGTQHYKFDYGDGHQSKRRCTECHEHKFADSHASGLACNTCHSNTKPVPSHTGFSLPKDCTKCHAIAINSRMNIMKQMSSLSHHVQNVKTNNLHCYACHWEATSHGMIDSRYHEGYNFKNHSTIKNAKVDLVLWQPGRRPGVYETISTAITFVANKIGTAGERTEVTKVTAHCLSCHSDKNNDTIPFNDCKTPRQYAWDRSSIAARYSNTGKAVWGKYSSTTNAAKKKIWKSFSAHGNAVENAGGWNVATGLDGTVNNLRRGTQNVQCFDCHSSHGSYTVGVTSSYVTFNGTKNGGNLKETQNGVGGYSVTYKAKANTSGINPYNTGAGQCFDCHMTENAGTTPWGYKSTFGAASSIKGYLDSDRFADGPTGPTKRYPYKAKTLKGGHLKPFTNISTATTDKIGGLCTPCHDPHGVTPSLGDDMAYALPLLKGTWMTSPYKEDVAQNNTANPPNTGSSTVNATTYVYTDQKTFGGSSRVQEDDSKFAGLCLKCHPKDILMATSQSWKGIARVHKTVKGWGGNNQHSFTCSKCHTPHVSDLPRLMTTNCLDYRHRGRVSKDGQAGYNYRDSVSGFRLYLTVPEYHPYKGSFPKGEGSSTYQTNCHPTGKAWPDNYWNWKTPWVGGAQ